MVTDITDFPRRVGRPFILVFVFTIPTKQDYLTKSEQFLKLRLVLQEAEVAVIAANLPLG